MTRSTNTEKSQRLNRAFELLAKGYTVNYAAGALVAMYGISLRQAYKYLQEAQQIGHLIPVVEPTIPITLKIPEEAATKLRAYSKMSNMTMGDIVGRAILTFLAGEGFYG